MLLKHEVVWRHLLHEETLGRRRYPSVTSLADELGMRTSTVHDALQRPASMDIVAIRGAGGLRLLDPLRLLLFWTGQRQMDRDLVTLGRSRLDAPTVERSLLERGWTLSGPGALVIHRGRNDISDYDHVVAYRTEKTDDRASDSVDCWKIPGAEERGSTHVHLLAGDAWLTRYGNVCPFAQAYVDVFQLPGWAASRFVSEVTHSLAAAHVA